MMEIYIKSEENKSQIISNTKLEESPADNIIKIDKNKKDSQLLTKKIKRSTEYTHNQQTHKQIKTIFYKEKNLNQSVE